MYILSTNCYNGLPCYPLGISVRGVAADLVNGGDPTNLIAWVSSGYDITTVPWGTWMYGNFANDTETTPSTMGYGGSGAYGFTENTSVCPSFANPPTDPQTCVWGQTCGANLNVARAQVWLPCPTAYYVLAFGTPYALYAATGGCSFTGGVNTLAQGCIYTPDDDQFPLIVDVPVPDDSLDPDIIVQGYLFGLIQPGTSYPVGGVLAGGVGPTLPDLNFTELQAGMLFGANWNPSQTCNGPTGDPFDAGSYPPP